MSDNRIVKIETILGSQIPSFLSGESPLFQEFLKQYYLSQEHTTGVLDLAAKLHRFKNLEEYTSDIFYTVSNGNSCFLTEPLNVYSDIIEVNSTIGFPEKYGLIQIDDEIITYANKTETQFIGCLRAFSGITEIKDDTNSSGLVFQSTNASEHKTKTSVKNLNLLFYQKLFEKFKTQYLPDFEGRTFNDNINLDLILSRARDFYLSKGTDTSYKILFEILYDDSIKIFKPQDFIIKSSQSTNIVTKNILVELVSGEFNPLDLIGLSIYQNNVNGTTSSASIYNVEYRPTDNLNLYEISLDTDSFVYDFVSTKKTSIIEKVENGFLVDSTIGFSNSGNLYLKLNNSTLTSNYIKIAYSEKSLTKFSGITGIDINVYNLISAGDELVEDNLVYIKLTDNQVLSFRLLNLIQSFDYSNTNNAKINDIIPILSFGENLSGLSEYSSWIYNYPTYHNVKTYDRASGDIELYDKNKFKINESILLLDTTGTTNSSKVIAVTDNGIRVSSNDLTNISKLISIKKVIEKSNLNPTEPSYVQNTYLNEDDESLIVAASGLPYYNGNTTLNTFTFSLVGISSIFETRDINEITTLNHNLLNGTRVYLESQQTGISTGYYFLKKISSNTVTLYRSTGDLILSFIRPEDATPINLKNTSNPTILGKITLSGYENINKGFANQLLLKQFFTKKTYIENKINSSTQINSIEDAYSTFNI